MGRPFKDSDRLLKFFILLSSTFLGLYFFQYVLIYHKIKDFLAEYGVEASGLKEITPLLVLNIIVTLILVAFITLFFIMIHHMEKTKVMKHKLKASMSLKNLDLYSLIREENTYYTGRKNAKREIS